jgi:hypothetical protein
MPDDVLARLIDVLSVFQKPLTRPGFTNFLVVAVGWIQSYGVHAVTQALVVTGVAGKRHHEAFHRFFSRGTWKPDQMGRQVFDRLERWTGVDSLRVALDDTLAPKKGPEVFGIGSHLDAVRSTKRQRIFCFGHCWVTLAVLIDVPFSNRVWALPVLFRLYRNKKECKKHGAVYRKKTELAREMLDVIVGWTQRRIDVAADSAYCNNTVTRDLSPRVHLLGAMRPDAVLTALPSSTKPGPRGGRPRKRGKLLPKPEAIAKDKRRPWKTCEVFVYGRKQTIRYKTLTAQWYRACGTRLLRIVIVATQRGAVPIRVFFTTDASLNAADVIAGYGARWSIECFFRNAKQLLGFADSSARKQEAVLRVAPFVGLVYTSLVLWFVEGAYDDPVAAPPLRPWYPHKRGLSFEDILRAARRTLYGFDVLVPSRTSDNLRKLAATRPRPARTARKMAA